MRADTIPRCAICGKVAIPAQWVEAVVKHSQVGLLVCLKDVAKGKARLKEMSKNNASL